MKAVTVLVTALFLFCGNLCTAQGAQPVTSSLVVKLGGDTIVVDTYTIINNHLYGKAFIRFFENHIREYDVAFRSDGSIEKFSMATMHPGNSSVPFISKTGHFRVHVDMTFSNDTAYFSFTEPDGTESRLKHAASSIDFIGGWVPIFPLMDWTYRRLKASENNELNNLRTTNGWSVEQLGIRYLHKDTLLFGGPFIDYSKIIVGENGVKSIDGMGSAYNFTTTQVAPIDVELLARRMSKTPAMTAPSPRDSVVFDHRGNRITIEYGRPFARGRLIFGGVVPYDSLWRTGANAETRITLAGAIRIGKKVIPKGTYSLYSIPRKESWTLIFSNDLESWPTNPDRKKELAHVEMKSVKRPSRQEQFTIEVLERKKNGELRLSWDDTDAYVDFVNHGKN